MNGATLEQARNGGRPSYQLWYRYKNDQGIEMVDVVHDNRTGQARGWFADPSRAQAVTSEQRRQGLDTRRTDSELRAFDKSLRSPIPGVP
jgi:hypothetical protein